MVCYTALLPALVPISFIPSLSLVQEHFEKSCFVQPCVQGSARVGWGQLIPQTWTRSGS